MKQKTMKQTKITLAILFCILILLSGCGAEKSNSFQLATDTHENEKEFSYNGLKQAKLLYNQEWLPYISFQDEYYIADYGESAGKNYSYAVYNMRKEDETSDEIALYWEIVVLQENRVAEVLHVEEGEHGAAFPSASEMVTEIDVNFDGENDILICLGHFGSQGAFGYKCFLSVDGSFVHCPSFTEIANPVVDSVAQVVRSTRRNRAASHSWGIFTFAENAFIETERLTEEPVRPAESEKEIWSWKHEVFSDGEWQIKEYYTDEDCDSKTIHSKLDGAESHWGLDQAKWYALLN